MRFFHLVFILLITVPLFEIWLLIQVGSSIGAVTTVFMVVFTAVLGVSLLRHQSLSTMQRMQNNLAHGELPVAEMLEGPILLLSGLLLLTPGFFTDTLGFLGLIPWLRKYFILFILKHYLSLSVGQPQQSTKKTENILEGQYWHERDK